MPSGVYKHLKHTNPNCQCTSCKGRRGEYKGKNNPNFGRHHTNPNCQCCACKSKRRESIAWNKGLTSEIDERILKGVSHPMFGKHHTEEAKRKVGRANTGKKRTEEVKRNIGLKSKNIMKKLWQNPEYREKQLKAMFKGLNLKPNKPEILLNSILQELFPNQYKYVGDGSILIGYKNPDFINVNGQKKIIELFGDYWHKPGTEQQRINLFARYGYHTLIIWESELKDMDKLKKRIIDFNNKVW